jgi:dTDP-4-dehydrorhamnose reductase
MKFLLYGGKGWIGSQIYDLLNKLGHEVIIGTSRIDNYDDTLNEITNINPHRVICTTGRTSGGKFNNIDYLEDLNVLPINLRDNLIGPINLARITNYYGIHMVYLGTGCIYHYDDVHQMPNKLDLLSVNGFKGFTENDLPNFTGSQYSSVKGVTDQLIRQYNNVLNARIRMPISSDLHPRNYISKILSYKNIIDIPNSMTILDDMLPILIDMSINKTIGSINLVNPGVISPVDILKLIKNNSNSNELNFNIIPLDKLPTIGKRSNNYLDTTLLEKMYPNIKPINESIINVTNLINLHFN